MKFNAMFQPIEIGPMTVKNRFVVPPMGNNFANTDGTMSEQSAAYYKERAKGGFGLITIEATVVHKGAKEARVNHVSMMIPPSRASAKSSTDVMRKGQKFLFSFRMQARKEMQRTQEHRSQQQQAFHQYVAVTFRNSLQRKKFMS